MTNSLDKLTATTRDEIITESDLEEIGDLISTDDESETESKGNFVKKGFFARKSNVYSIHRSNFSCD